MSQKVLLVEDDAWFAEVLARVLTEAEYEVFYAPHAQSAMTKIDAEMPDAIVLDMLLTGATAFGLLNELQSHEDTRKIPVILCTNSAESLEKDNLKAYGVVRVLDKTTMVPQDLVAAVRSAL